MMLQYSVYSVISPEGCASILWRSADKAEAAAEAMGITADRLLKLDLVDEVIPEPLGGAHRDVEAMSEAIKNALVTAVAELKALPPEELVRLRREKLANFGNYREG
jgi:acetyl-CoA carboxylase carboxyl transferase subunit alpha